MIIEEVVDVAVREVRLDSYLWGTSSSCSVVWIVAFRCYGSVPRLMDQSCIVSRKKMEKVQCDGCGLVMTRWMEVGSWEKCVLVFD